MEKQKKKNGEKKYKKKKEEGWTEIFKKIKKNEKKEK